MRDRNEGRGPGALRRARPSSSSARSPAAPRSAGRTTRAGDPTAGASRAAPTGVEVIAEFREEPVARIRAEHAARRIRKLLRERLTKQCELALELWQEHPGPSANRRPALLPLDESPQLLPRAGAGAGGGGAAPRSEASRSACRSRSATSARRPRSTTRRSRTSTRGRTSAAPSPAATGRRSTSTGARRSWSIWRGGGQRRRRNSAGGSRRAGVRDDARRAGVRRRALRSLEIAGRPLALDFVDALTGTSAAPIGAAGRPLLLHVAAVTGGRPRRSWRGSTRCARSSPRSARTS